MPFLPNFARDGEQKGDSTCLKDLPISSNVAAAVESEDRK